MAGDWIKMHRKTLDSFVNSDAGLMHLWVNLLLRANWKPSWFAKQRIGVGQVAFACGNMADDLKISRSTLIRRLKDLEEGGQIAVKANNRFTVVTILKWKTYQDCCVTTDTTDDTTNGTTADTPTDTSSEHPANIQRTSDDTHPKKGRSKEGKKILFTSEDSDVARWMHGLIQNLNPSVKEPNFDSWSDCIRKMRECDKRTHDQIRVLFGWVNAEPFWKTNVLSPAKLREKWDALETQRIHGRGHGRNSKPATGKGSPPAGTLFGAAG